MLKAGTLVALVALVIAVVVTYQKVPVDVEIIAFNDFHGNLKSPGTIAINDPVDATKTIEVQAGGVEYLATAIQTLKAGHPNNVVVSAGDVIGASPLFSSLFHDEPTIQAMDMMGLEFSSVGNHEFDEGKSELLRMQNGGCHPVDGCRNGEAFHGAQFKYLAANVVDLSTMKTLFPAYQVKTFAGIPVAFVGVTLKNTPGIVSASAVTGLRFEDEVDTINRLVPEIKSQGIETIVVLIHEGGRQSGDFNDCTGISGAIVEIVKRIDKAVDVVVSGHTHAPYNCTIDGRLVTSASSYGRVITGINLKLDPKSRDVVSMKAENHIVRSDVAKDPGPTALINRLSPLVTPLESRVVGSATEVLDTEPTASRESSLGDIIADAQLEATNAAAFGRAQIAFVNSGSIRAAIRPVDGKVTYGQLFASQPFGGNLVTMSLLGSEIHELLEQQWAGPNERATKVLQVSAGFTYTWDAASSPGRRVDSATIRLNGAVINPVARYRITVNDFLSTGGDNFTVLNNGTNRSGGVQDVDALEQFFKNHLLVRPGRRDRIHRIN